jgi:hypothetical protein
MEDVPDEVKSLLPLENNLKQQLRQAQAAQERFVITGTTAAELEIPHELTVDGNGLPFLQVDIITSEGKRVFIFATDTLLDNVNDPTIEVGFADGTFKSCSKPFIQIWIIRVCIKRVNIPILYAMLENKSSTSYKAVLEFLCHRCPRFRPDFFVVDFEAAEHSAIMHWYPSIHIQGCRFHYCQVIILKNSPYYIVATSERALLRTKSNRSV